MSKSKKGNVPVHCSIQSCKKLVWSYSLENHYKSIHPGISIVPNDEKHKTEQRTGLGGARKRPRKPSQQKAQKRVKKEIPKRKKQNKNPKKRNHPKDNPAQQAKELQKLLGVNVPVPRLPQRPRKKTETDRPIATSNATRNYGLGPNSRPNQSSATTRFRGFRGLFFETSVGCRK